MSGYYKLISRSDDTALVDVVGWSSRAVVLNEARLSRIIADLEALQVGVHGEAARSVHLLWEEFRAFKSMCKER
jgi:hypothetical protein